MLREMSLCLLLFPLAACTKSANETGGLFSRSSDAPARQFVWMVAPSSLSMMQDIDGDLTQAFFNNARTYIFGPPASPPVPAGWLSNAVADFKSYAALQAALAGGTIDPTITAILYDNEAWPATPSSERRDAALYEAQFASLAHANGYTFLSAPATNLVPLQPSYDSTQRIYPQYLSMGFPSFSAGAPAELYEIQAQGSEAATAYFGDFVGQAAAQGRAANPSALVLAGISTGPSGQTVTCDDLLRAIQATQDAVDGYWLNIPRQSPDCPRC